MKRLVESRAQLIAYLFFTTAILILIWRVGVVSSEFREEVREQRHRECLADNRRADGLNILVEALIASGDPPSTPEARADRERAIVRFKELVKPATQKQNCS